MNDRPTRDDWWTAVRFCAWCVLLAVLLSFLLGCSVARAQVTPDTMRPVVCRIENQKRGSSSLGSGTLIDKTDDGAQGLVVTCAHLFSEGQGRIEVRFSSGQRHYARLVDIDRQADLALLAIAYPTGQPVEVALEMSSQAKLQACGYGPRGVYRCAVGPQVGEAVSAGQMSLLIGDPVRSGDSGGGVFDERGRLVAVIWGEAQGVTYASYGGPLRRFLGRTLARFRGEPGGVSPRRNQVCVGGQCPLVRPPARERPRTIRPWPGSDAPPLQNGQQSIVVDPRWNALEGKLQEQIDRLQNEKQDRGEYLTRDEVPAMLPALPDMSGYARQEQVERIESDSTSRHTGLLAQLEALSGRGVGRAAGTAAVGLLGLSGPAGWAVIAASSVGGWLIGRRVKRRIGGAGGRRRRRRFRR